MSPAPTFTEAAEARTAHLRAAIDDCRFLRELGEGTLDPAAFRHYLEQDALYLAGYARALALLAARAPAPGAAAFWASSAHGASAVESALHADLLSSGALPPAAGPPGPVHPSPTTLGYVSYLVASAATAPYPVAAAAVLPCFRVYADVAHRLATSAAAVLSSGAQHPYARWVAAYDAEGFRASTATATRLVDAAAAGAGDDLAPLHAAFATATRYELLFWEAAHRREGWALPLAPPS